MTDIRKAADCGNSPRNRLLEQFVIAVARADAARIAELVTSDIRWWPVGGRTVVGVKPFCKAITRYGPAHSLTIEHVLSHGRVGACDGVVEFGLRRRAFCYVVEFSNAKGSAIKEITAYTIAVR